MPTNVDEMSYQKCYYRAGKDFKGKYEPCRDVIARDHYRAVFCAKLRSDAAFRKRVLRWDDKKPEEMIREYESRGACPGPCIKTAQTHRCGGSLLRTDGLSRGKVDRHSLTSRRMV